MWRKFLGGGIEIRSSLDDFPCVFLYSFSPLVMYVVFFFVVGIGRELHSTYTRIPSSMSWAPALCGKLFVMPLFSFVPYDAFITEFVLVTPCTYTCLILFVSCINIRCIP